ncbi:MAG: radical SAM protein [Promethearchaeota archaeon]
MSPNLYPYIPKYISLRRYLEVSVIDLKEDESYLIDDEALSVLQQVDGLKSTKEIIDKFSEDKREEAEEALETFHQLGIIIKSPIKIEDSKIKSSEHVNLPQKNPFGDPYLKNFMINITEKCNLTCKHCYIPDKKLEDMPLDKLESLIKDFYDLQGNRLILTGGEPFLYTYLKELLIYLKDFSLKKVILSNGTLIEKADKEILKLLKENYVEVYVSLDGLENTHNDFRNANCFQDTIKGIKKLINYDINISINTMIHQLNLQEIEDIYQLIQSLGPIQNWSLDVPTFDELLSDEIKSKYMPLPKDAGNVMRNYGWGVIFESEGGGPRNYACGPHLMAVDVTGRVTKCGFFSKDSPGNIFELGMKKSWEQIQENLNWCIEDLQCGKIDCKYLGDCRGGCRYRAYINTGDIMGFDYYKCSQFGKEENK